MMMNDDDDNDNDEDEDEDEHFGSIIIIHELCCDYIWAPTCLVEWMNEWMNVVICISFSSLGMYYEMLNMI